MLTIWRAAVSSTQKMQSMTTCHLLTMRKRKRTHWAATISISIATIFLIELLKFSVLHLKNQKLVTNWTHHYTRAEATVCAFFFLIHIKSYLISTKAGPSNKIEDRWSNIGMYFLRLQITEKSRWFSIAIQ